MLHDDMCKVAMNHVVYINYNSVQRYYSTLRPKYPSYVTLLISLGFFFWSFTPYKPSTPFTPSAHGHRIGIRFYLALWTFRSKSPSCLSSMICDHPISIPSARCILSSPHLSNAGFVKPMAAIELFPSFFVI